MKHLSISKNPWAWVPSLYMAEGVPNILITSVAITMYQDMQLSQGLVALLTSLFGLPWMIKPLWSPFVDIYRTKRQWILMTQAVMVLGFVGVAFAIPMSNYVFFTILFFLLVGFSSATHDIAADGFYMLALDSHQQSLFVGVRNTFYRMAMIGASSLSLMVAGNLAPYYRSMSKGWSHTFLLIALIFAAIVIYNLYAIPRTPSDHPLLGQGRQSGRRVWQEFAHTFVTFFQKPGVGLAIAVMLLYRLPEALLAKVAPLFLHDHVTNGGLGLTTSQMGFAGGTVGLAGLLAGGVLGGALISRDGFRRWLWPMVCAITLPDAVYVYLSCTQPDNIAIVSSCLFVEQFGYGFGFTAYSIFMIYFARGGSETSHFAMCTAFMLASMVLPGLFTGWLYEGIDQLTGAGYVFYFLLVMACCPVTFLIARHIHIDPDFGKKNR